MPLKWQRKYDIDTSANKSDVLFVNSLPADNNKPFRTKALFIIILLLLLLYIVKANSIMILLTDSVFMHTGESYNRTSKIIHSDMSLSLQLHCIAMRVGYISIIS